MPTQAFLVKWKHNGTIRPAHTLFFGESFTVALRQHFHFNAVDAVETYEVIFNALKDVSAEDHLSLNSLVKSFFNKVNNFYSDSDFNCT